MANQIAARGPPVRWRAALVLCSPVAPDALAGFPGRSCNLTGWLLVATFRSPLAAPGARRLPSVVVVAPAQPYVCDGTSCPPRGSWC